MHTRVHLYIYMYIHIFAHNTSLNPILAMSPIHVIGLGKSGERSTGSFTIRHGYGDAISILDRARDDPDANNTRS